MHEKKFKHQRSPDPLSSDTEVSPPSKRLKSSPAPENDTPLTVVWEDAILEFRQKTEPRILSDPNAQQMEQLMEKHRIGGAYIHTFGKGHVRGLVKLGSDPNSRGNPCDVDFTHVRDLFRVFSTPGAKRDHESPITLMISSSRIDPDCLRRMAAVDPRSASAEMPPLVLADVNPEIAELEGLLIGKRNDQRWLTEEELAAIKSRLNNLREESASVTLLNGRHRILALEMVEAMLEAENGALVSQVRTQKISSDDVPARVDDLLERAKLATYRVEVYDADHMPDELLNWLVRNADMRPAQGMGPAEKVWWTAERFRVLMDQTPPQEPPATRADQINYAYNAWSKEVTSSQHTIDRSGRRRGDWAGNDPVSRLFTEPLTLEMVLDTRQALVVYGSIMDHALSVALIQPHGALLACHLWLATRNFLKIFDVSGAKGLADAEIYLDSTPHISSDGYIAAVPHWDRLHSNPQRTPEPTRHFSKSYRDEFDRLYISALQELEHPTHDIDWSHPSTARRIRRVFDDFGTWVHGRTEDPFSRAISASLRLYARLPLNESSPNGPVFYPASALPSSGWLGRIHQKRPKDKINMGLLVLEYLIDPFLPIWIQGGQAVGKSSNSNNWRARSVGLHQIPMRLIDAFGLGKVEHVLQKAIELIADPQLHNVLSSVDTNMGEKISSLLEECCVLRSYGASYPILEQVSVELGGRFGDYEDLLRRVNKARADLRAILAGPSTRAIAVRIEDMRFQHPFLDDLIWPSFWTDFPLSHWLAGFNTAEERRYRNVNSLFGWAIFTKRMAKLLEDGMNNNRNSQHLLALSLQLSELTGQPHWWSGLSISHKPPSPPLTPRDDSPPCSIQATDGDRSDVFTPPPGERSTSGVDKSISATNKRTKSKRLKMVVEIPVPPRSKGQRGKSNRDNSMSPAIHTCPSGSPQSSHSAVRPSVGQMAFPKRSSRPLHEILALRNPGHLFTHNCVGKATLDSVFGHLLMDETTPDIVGGSLSLIEERMGKIFSHINSERQNLRQSLLAVSDHCLESPYGGDFAETGLAGVNAHYKDIFVARVARIFVRELHMSPQEALNEACGITAADKLFETEVKSLDGDTGVLKVDLTSTFARATQDEVGSSGLVEIGHISGSRKERREVHDLMRWLHAPRASGRTEAESITHGADCGTLLSIRSKKADKSCVTWMSPPPLPADPPTPVNWKEPVSTASQVESQYNLLSTTPEHPRTDRLTLLPQYSGFSTGLFENPKCLPELVPQEKVQLYASATRIAGVSRKAWRSSQEADVAAFHTFIDYQPPESQSHDTL